ncbi:hypothetical protein VTH06DRAFT_2038 [Thermothelomyces fergusii]
MPSSLPVPSKAALTALRGLVVGTSCTLALIAEDRRRKINKAMRAIENGERIKSAKRYRPGGAALALALEEEALWDPRLGSPPPVGPELHPHGDPGATPAPVDKSRERRQRQWEGEEEEEEEETNVAGLPAETAGTWVTAPPPKEEKEEDVAAPSTPSADGTLKKVASPSPSRPHDPVGAGNRPRIRPLHGLPPSSAPAPAWTLTNAESLRAYAFPTVEDMVVKVHEACDSADGRKLSDALRTVLEAMGHNLAPENLDRPWIEATGRLCRTFQHEGRIDEAARLLYQILCRGPVRESDYLNHEPFGLIESLLARAEANKERGEAWTAADVDSAANLFVRKLTERPAGPDRRVYELGRRLLEACFSADRLQRVFGIYRRCMLAAEGSCCDLSSWFLTKLHEKQEHTAVVRYFITTFPQSSPTEAALHAIGDVVVESVERAGDHRPEEVLRTMRGICAALGSTKLSPKWVIRLFLSHWRKHRDFEQIERMFEELWVSRLRESVFRHSNVYRIMVELALEAGEEFKAEAYFALAVSQKRSLRSDVRFLGIFARFHAADGDWEAVRADFEAMNRKRTPHGQAYGRVFVPVLKAYGETHTVRETEAFLRHYVEEFKVPLCGYTVTLMAKHYGAIRDVGSLIGWLDYCSRAGFPVGAAFTNAILARCRREWNFPFRELRTLFRKLQALNPDWVDGHTERIMADSALSDSRYGGRAARGRLLSLRLDLTRAAAAGTAGGPRADVEEEVVSAMKEALRGGSPGRALAIYRRAVHTKVPFSHRALQLAVQAHLARAPDDLGGAYALLRRAQGRGEDVDRIINHLLARQLSAIAAAAAPSPARRRFYGLELIDCPFPPANIGTHETRALIDVPNDHPAAAPSAGGARGYIENVVLPALPPHVQPSVRAALADGRIPRSMPNSWLPSTKQTQHDGVIVVGDAHNMRHPLTGGGMTVAFNDALLLASLLAPGRIPSLADHAAVRAAMAAFHWRRKRLTSMINVLAQALYSLFAADDWQLRALQRGCFAYFQRGWTDEPVAMLGGILHRPATLAYHFFSVAFLAIGMHIADVCCRRGRSLFSPLAVLTLPLALVQAAMILWKACVVFLPVMAAELR